MIIFKVLTLLLLLLILLPLLYMDCLLSVFIAINYLNSARKEQRNDPHPFTEAVIHLITGYAQGVPRQLNTICEKVLRQAASDGYEIVDETCYSRLPSATYHICCSIASKHD